MSASTMDSEEARDVKKCRLCLGNFITNETQTGIDILTSKDVQKLVREVYEVQILPGDIHSTMLCMPCYQQLVNDYKFRMKLFTQRKMFKLNQTMLIAQIIAFQAEPLPETDCDGKRFASVREKSTQTETPQQPNTCAPIASQPQTNGTKENNVEQQQCSTVTATEETTTTKATNTETITTETTTTETAPMDIQTQQLVPVLVDCLKDPLYLKALHPLQVSTDPNDPVPLQYMCSRCYKTFESKEQSEHHNQIMDCAPTCRYCLAKRTPYHYCTEQSKYWSIKDDIEGSSQYVTTYDTITSRSESLVVLAEEAAADVLIAKNDEPKTKHAKLDANRNGRHLSSDRATSDREPSLINISSSEDELLLNIAEPKPAARSSSSSKKKKRRGSKWV